MNRVILKIDGMACSMCEAHMNDTVRKTVPEASKVSSSHKKGETIFLAEQPFDQEKLKKAVSETGYEIREIIIEPYEKKGLFGLW